jgi:hypothetical protein
MVLLHGQDLIGPENAFILISSAFIFQFNPSSVTKILFFFS